MNKEWLRLVMRRKSFGHQASLSDQAKRMFFMASTDLDHFRRFVLESSFLDTYNIDDETLEKIKGDDVELMLFSFKYLAASLFGAEGLPIREGKIQERVKEIKKDQENSVKESVEAYKDIKAARGEEVDPNL